MCIPTSVFCFLAFVFGLFLNTLQYDVFRYTYCMLRYDISIVYSFLYDCIVCKTEHRFILDL